MIRIVSIVIIIFAVLIFILGGYLLGKGNNSKPTSVLAPQIASPEPSSQATPSTQASSQPSGQSNVTTVSADKTIIKALYDKSYAELLPFFAREVDVLIEATECCGIKPAAEADTRVLNYLDSAKDEWNFDQNSPAIINIKGENPAGFQNSLVGTADNKYTLKLTLDENSKIKVVVFANK